jgi:hypothetical protein
VRAARIALAGWLIPGGAFLLQRRYVPFAVFAVLVCVTFGAGLALDGALGWPEPAALAGLDGFDTLVARAGAATKLLAGAPYLIAQFLGAGGPWLSGALHEHGTTLLTLSGLFNLLAMASALEPR